MKQKYPRPTVFKMFRNMLKSIPVKSLLITVMLMFSVAEGFGQGVDCGTAELLYINGSCDIAIITDNAETAPANTCGGIFRREGWYTFTISGGPLNVTITANATRNLALQLISSTAACTGLSQINCVNDVAGAGTGYATETLTSLLSNGIYYVKVLNVGANNDMDLSNICVTGTSPENTVPTTGNNSYSLCSGNLYDNGGSAGNYSNNSNGYTVLNPSVPGNFVRVSGSITAEGGYDYLTIYDGTGTAGTILWGGSAHGTGTACTAFTVPIITSTTGPLTVRFYSDGNNQCAGFDLTVSCVAPVPPTITSFTPSNACASSSQTVVITGTNFTGATSVTIGGTAAVSYIVNSATQITATIGAGTTGFIRVTTPGGNATSVGTFTVNALPAAIGGGAATVCTGATSPAFTNATAGGTWSIINGTGSATISAGGVVTGVTAGTVTVVYTLPTTCSITRALTVATVPAAVATPTPANAATGVCYAGGGAVTSISWGAAAGATSYDVYFGAGSLPGAVTANVATNSYTTGTLLANTTYYWRIVAKNGCGNAATSATFSFTTAGGPCYCVPVYSISCSSFITNVTFNTINNSSGCANTTNTSYTNYAASGTPTTSLLIGSSYNLSVTTNLSSIVSAWIDLNANGVYEVSEWTQVYVTGTNGNVNILIPGTATPGLTTIRIRSRQNGNPNGSGNACSAMGSGEAEDYGITLVTPTPCATPTTQPTAIMLTPSGSTIGGSFAPAVPNPSNYLVVQNTTGVAPPAPVNGTNYVIGGTLGAGNIIIDNDTNTSFVATGLVTTTTYYFFIYSFNSICTGGPLYNSTAPLSGNTTTTTADPTYCTPSVGTGYESLVYFSNISFVGTLNDISNSSTYSLAPRGYQDFSSIANRSRQAQGQGINVSTQTSSRGYLKAWVDWNRDGDFIDPGEKVYDVGGIASYSTTFGFIIPAAQPVGNYRVRIRINKDDNVTYDPGAISTFDSCQNIDYYGETEDYTFTVVASCSAVITSITDGITCGPGTVNVTATSVGGVSQYRWYTTELGGTPIATTATGTWTTPSISSTTTYWVTGFNGCESLVRTKVTARVNPLATITFTPSVPEICGENNVLSLTAAGDIQQTYLVDEKFNSGLGVMTNENIISNGANDALTAWQNHSSTFVPAQQVWFPAIASGMNGNNFIIATSDVGPLITHNAVLSPILNTNTYLDLTLSFDIFYSRYYTDNSAPTLDYVTVDISTNGGVSWTEIDRYLTDLGYGTRFVNKTYNLNSYINNPNFRVRIRYYGEWCDGLAIDNFKLYGDVPLNTSFDWTSATPVAAFTDAACLVPYTTGTPITTVYIKPTLAQLEDLTFSFTATATLANGCSVSQAVSIDNKSKIWKGGTNGDWTDGSNWSPVGVPDATNCVIIPPASNNSVISGTNYNGYGKTLQVINGGNLRINPSNTLTITDFVEVRGATSVFDIENSASLIQINNAVNIGNINYKRIAPGIRGFDYVYWSSPVANQAMETIYTSPVSGFKYEWNPTVPNTNAGLGNWENASGVMQRGKGYIIRGSSSYGMGATNIAATFTGIPHNGTIPFTVARGSYTGVPYNGTNGVQITNLEDNYNLLGNPYPSAIDVANFLGQNSSVIHGNVKLWRHGSAPAAIVNPFYGSFTYNYNGDDYLTINSLGISDPVGSDPIIKSGQAFLVQMLDGPAATGIINFTNSMRLQAGLPLSNSNFFRNSDAVVNSESTEKHRIWLDIMDQNNIVSSTLVGYATGASDAFDSPFDARSSVPTFMKLYSLIDNEVYDIQGRSLPFNNNDHVPLGITTVQAGTYSIGLNTIDGLFLAANQGIYVEDKTTNIIHNLKTNPYSFTSAVGTFHNRFVLRYTNETLGNDDFIYDASSVWVSSTNELTVKSSKTEIQSVRVFDILGRELANFPNVNGFEIPLTKIQKNNSGLIIQVTLKNGIVINKKTIY